MGRGSRQYPQHSQKCSPRPGLWHLVKRTHFLSLGAAQEFLRNGNMGVAAMRPGGWRSTTVMGRHLAHASYKV